MPTTATDYTDAAGNESGATAVEYSIMVALVAAVIILIVLAVGQRTEQAYSSVCDAMDEAKIGTAAC